ncbi:hypothetical protein [Bacillus sp. N12A5]|uniref:hypothetical protein n=1 Tax=unclassified Bacillus (in: firmicutes) TaxID=185979 RepID=UPI003B01DEFA
MAARYPQEAVLLEKRGMDIIALQGSEAGGRRGSFLPVSGESALGLMSLIPRRQTPFLMCEEC